MATSLQIMATANGKLNDIYKRYNVVTRFEQRPT